MVADVVYLDSSAIVKTIIREAESTALRRFLRSHAVHASSSLARAEVLRAVRRSDPAAVRQAHAAMQRLLLVELTDTLLTDAGLLDPRLLRTLDALHLSAAKSLGPDLTSVVTYDARMAEAARGLGFAVEAPSS